jgi:thiamine biosynthesis lipoprotein
MPLDLVAHQFTAMGGPCKVHFWQDSQYDSSEIRQTLEAEVRRLEAKFSRYLNDSLLSKLNRGELNDQSLDEETVGLLNYATQCFELSGHMFDPTVGILRKVWRYNENQIPSSSQLKPLLECIGWEKVNWNGESLRIPPHMEIDFGGIVKEFAADRLNQLLKQFGLSGLVNLAGDIAVSDPPPNEKAWRVAIQNPRGQGAIATIDLASGSIAGSGDYERYVEVNGKRYCHILKPDTGFPAEECFSSVSVIADSCLVAGSVATIAMLKGHEGKGWLDDMELPYLAFDQSLNALGSIEV